jgi:hypothetical protein
LKRAKKPLPLPYIDKGEANMVMARAIKNRKRRTGTRDAPDQDKRISLKDPPSL